MRLDFFEQLRRLENGQCHNPDCTIDSATTLNLKYCGNCGAASYCCHVCQRSHWRVHKKLCKILAPYKAYIVPLAIPQKGALARINLDIPPVHVEYIRRFGFDSFAIHIATARKILQETMEASLERLLGSDTKALLRWHEASANCREFIQHAETGDIFRKKRYTAYKPLAPQQFRNTPTALPAAIENGSTVVDIGFVDFGIIIDSLGGLDDNGAPVKVIGVEKEPFNVAKALVMYTMCATVGNTARSVVEVWLSSLWSEDTYYAFCTAVKTTLQKLDIEISVRKILVFWNESSRMTREESLRFQFGASLSNDSIRFCTNACNLLREEDRVDYLRYYYTKAFYEDESTVVGSLVMSIVDERVGIRQIFEDAFEAVPGYIHSPVWPGFHDEEKSFIGRSRRYVESQMERYMMLVQKGVLRFKPRLGDISLQNLPLLAELADHTPNWVSWSNVVDYVPPRDFHRIARMISCNDTVHHFHSINWVTTVFGADIYDVAEDFRMHVFSTGLFHIEISTTSLKGLAHRGPFHFRNVCNMILARRYANFFLRYFFEDQEVTCGSLTKETPLGQPNPFSRIDTTIFLAFAYKESGISLPPDHCYYFNANLYD